MLIKNWSIKIKGRLASKWEWIDLEQLSPSLTEGWYLGEFFGPSNSSCLPKLFVDDQGGTRNERTLVGTHSGRNRMMFFLPAGKLIDHRDSIDIISLVRITPLEARLRTLLICLRYLRDFLGIRALIKLILLVFQEPFARSSELLSLYSPEQADRQADGRHLVYVERWRRLDKVRFIANWLAGNNQVAVVIEHESQREELQNLLVAPDQIIKAGSGEALDSSIEYVIPLQKSERLRHAAIVVIKRAIKRAENSPIFIYTDHDYLDADLHSRMHPVFKPNPSFAYLSCFNYVGPAVVLSKEIVLKIGINKLLDDDVIYSIALDCFEDITNVVSISEALFVSNRTKMPETPRPFARSYNWGELSWLRRGDYNVLVGKEPTGDLREVDLIIPTRDSLDVLKPCLDSILQKTEYSNFQIIVVDNGSEKQETLDYLESLTTCRKVSIIQYRGEFNYSAINNFGVSKGNSPYIALLNNDVEVIKGDWLTHMMAWAVRSDVGVVGAKLLYPDNRVQHAGVTIGLGNAAGHIHRFEQGNAPGYQLRCLATQNMMAVTAACLITRRELFESINGLDEIDLKVAYNDVDYCLRVDRSGLQVIWTPEAVLYHHESVSRGDDMSDRQIERYLKELKVLQTRWKTEGFVDKYYNKHLRYFDEGVYPINQ